MRYFVYIGGVTLYGVTDVTETADRNIEVYDGVGQGNFPVGGSASLRGWEISCELTELDDRPGQEWTSAKRIFKKLESFRESKDPQRLVITSDYGKTSVQALLESYSKAEKESGVYDVKIKLTEYKPVSKKTTNVPYVERSGKVPVAEKVVFHSATEVAGAAITTRPYDDKTVEMLKQRDAWARNNYTYTDSNGNVKTTQNPNLVPTDTSVTIKPVDYLASPVSTTLSAFGTALKETDTIAAAFSKMDEVMQRYNRTVYK